jgi:hypothetical protein
MSRIFQNFTRGPADRGVEERETSVLTGPLKPQPLPEMQPAQPMGVCHVPTAGSKN